MITRAVLFERFVGRDAELAFLFEAGSACARTGRGTTVTISGEAGSGKSRLVTEFTRGSGNARAIVRVGCDEVGMPPYAPFLDVLHELAVRRELAGVASLARARTSLETSDADDLSADERRTRRHGEIARALGDAADRLGALTLVLEDAHWCDAGSLDAAASLAALCRRKALLLVVTYRSDDLRDDLGRANAIGRIEREGADRIVLGPLGQRELLASLRDVVPNESLGTLRTICDLAEGKPLVAEELARNLVERGGGEHVEAPRSLRAAVIERAERLGTSERALIARAAVFGRAMRHADADVLGAPVADVRRAFGAACELQLVVETELDGEPAFRFRHALTREILYRETLLFERRHLHGAIAEALERRVPVARAADIAYHWWAAGDAERTRAWNERAADLALGVAALADAVELLERALAAASDDPTAFARIAQKAGNALGALGRFDACIELAANAATRLASAGRHDDALRMRAIGARAQFDAYRLHEADREVSDLRSGVRPETATDVAFDLEILTCSVRAQQARYDEGFAAIERAKPLAESLGPSARVRLLSNEAMLYLRTRRIEPAEALLRETIALANAPGDARTKTNALLNLGGIAYYRGLPAEVLACAEASRAFAEATGAELAANRARSIIAHTAAELGDFARTRVLLHEAQRDEATSFPTWGAAELFLARATGDGAERLDAMIARAEAALPDTYLLKDVLRHAPWMMERAAAADLIRRLLPKLDDPEIGDYVACSVAAFGHEASVARVLAVRSSTAAPSRNAFDISRDRLVAARLHARSGHTEDARASAREAIPFFRERGFWLPEADAAELAGERDDALAILARVGATAELARVTSGAQPQPHAANPPTADALSRREEQVARLIAQGLSNRDVAERLSIALRTVETHLANAYDKLGVHSRTELRERLP